MKAIVIRQFGDPDVLKLEDVPTPAVEPGTALIRLHAVGVNPVDTYTRAGKSAPIPLPFTPGFDGAGVVEAVGPPLPNAQRSDPARSGTPQPTLRAGDRVYVARPPVDSAPGVFSGTYAQRVLSDLTGVFPLPSNITFQQGAAIGTPYATAWRALFQRARATPGQTVLIHGASGGVGLAACQIASAAGLIVIGTAGTQEGLDLVRRNGAAHAVSHRDPGYLDQVKAFTHGRGPDVILEMLANVNLQNDLELVARFGSIVVIGSRGSLDFLPRGTMTKDASIVGMMLRNCPMHEFAQVHAALGAGLASGVYRPIISLELPLADAAQSHVRIMEPAVHGKIVLTT